MRGVGTLSVLAIKKILSQRTSNINETGEDMEGESQTKTTSGSKVHLEIYTCILPFRIITINNMTMILSINKQPSDGD